MILLLKHVASVKMNTPNADFWVQRRGTPRNLGKVAKEFDPQAFGVEVFSPEILPDYLFWVVTLHQLKGYFKAISRGTLELKHITKEDVENIPVFIPQVLPR